jgi:hypothetical protein
MPCRPVVGCTKWVPNSDQADQHPTHAYVYPSSAGFTVLCDQEDTLFKVWDETVYTTSYTTCDTMGSGGIPNPLPHSTRNEYLNAMNQLARKIETSAGVSYHRQSAIHVGGDRAAVAAWYACPKTDSSSQGVRKIVLSRTPGGSRPTVTRC